MKKIHHQLEKSLISDEELTNNAQFIKDLNDPFGDWNKFLEESESETD